MQVITKKQSKVIAILLAFTMLLSCFGVMQGSVYAAENNKKMPYKAGDDISNAVFYIAVDADDDGTVDDYYYYSEDEIRNYDETVDYQYVNHGQTQTDSIKGAKLSSLIKNLGGDAKVEDTDFVKYMEYDGYHSNPNQTMYIDTVASLEDPNGVGNGSESGLPTETIVGYCIKTTYSKPDANNVNDTEYKEFKNFLREASPVRGYRQGGNANYSVLKMMMGVVITGNPDNYGQGTDTQGGYIEEHYSNVTGEKIEKDYHFLGLIAGMKWAAAARPLEWAKGSDAPQVITVEKTASAKAAKQVVKCNYKENDFLTITKKDGSKTVLTRSDLRKIGDVEAPESPVENGQKFTYFGYNKPMYVRYQGAWLKDVLGAVGANDQVLILDASGKAVDITENVEDYFVAYYYSESKSSSNISNAKRVPLNYEHAVLVDTKSAPVEYSNGDEDYVIESGKPAAEYSGIQGIVVTEKPAVPTKAKAVLSSYNKAKITWKAVPGAAGYTVYYKKSGASTWSSANVTKASYTTKALAKGAKYQFKVKAYTVNNQDKVYSDATAVVSVTTLKASTVKLTKSGKTAVKVKYTDISGESGYQIYRSTNAKKSYKKVKTMAANKTAYTDKKLKKGTTYYYKVRAYKKADGKTIYGPWSSVKKIKR